jgi:hypothetical protein
MFLWLHPAPPPIFQPPPSGPHRSVVEDISAGGWSERKEAPRTPVAEGRVKSMWPRRAGAVDERGVSCGRGWEEAEENT